MEIVGKVSKGSKMDQIYLSKNRENFSVGSYVIIKPLTTDLTEKIKQLKPYFYNLDSIEPIKIQTITQIFNLIGSLIKTENIIIIGSFLEPGFNFNDIDIIIISEKKFDEKKISRFIEEKIKIKTQVILFNNKTFLVGVSTDPLYQMMLSKCVAKKRFIYKIKNELNYKILDLHLLKSKILIDNFDILNGKEKYKLSRNLIAIKLFLDKKKITKLSVDNEIKNQLADTEKIKQNILNKTDFIRRYKFLYTKTFNKIIEGIKKENKVNNKNASK